MRETLREIVSAKPSPITERLDHIVESGKTVDNEVHLVIVAARCYLD